MDSEMLILKNNKEAQKFLALKIFDFFQTTATYGKEPKALESITRLFRETLSQYTLDQIRDAFLFYSKFFKGMPEPADIATIIERKCKPPFERSVYISIQKLPAEERTESQWAYMKDYENFIIDGEHR